MKTQIIVGFIAFGLICALPTFGQQKDVQGWREARWGMNENEILEAFKGEAIRLDKIDKWPGFYASIGINNFDIDGETYNVRFIMRENEKSLIQISLFATGGSYGTYGIRFKQLAQKFAEKYGTLSFKNDSNTESEIGWNFPSTIIEILYMNLKTSKYENLTIIYRVPKGKDKI